MLHILNFLNKKRGSRRDTHFAKCTEKPLSLTLSGLYFLIWRDINERILMQIYRLKSVNQNIFMNAKERLIRYLKSSKIGQTKFEEKVGISRGYINNNKGTIGTAILLKIKKACPELNTDWLISGEGEMLKESDGNASNAKSAPIEYNLKPKEYATHIKVKVVTTKSRAGFSEAYYAEEYLEDMPTVLIEADKNYKGKYLAFEVDGDSMEPEYNKGDIVICREIPRSNWQYKLHFDQWDFVIAHGTQGIMLKEITAHNVNNGEITCHSLNTKMHPDFTLNLKEIAFLYNVVEHRRPGRKYRMRK